MPTIYERSTKTIMRSVGYEFNKPISSSDLNEEQSILINNIIGYLNGDITASTAKFTVYAFTDSKPGITMTGIQYCVIDDNKNVFFGHIEPSVVISYPGTPASGSKYKLYAYWRSIDIDTTTTVYLDGIRANASQASIIETTTPNNILDSSIGSEVSLRKGLELTFVVVSDNANVPTLSGWSTAVQVASITLGSDLSSELKMTNPSLEISSSLEELSDTNIVNPAEGNSLFYDSASGKWINKDSSAVKILSATLQAGSTTLTFLDSSITSNSILVLGADTDIEYINKTLGNNTISYEFNAQSSNVNFRLSIIN